MNIKTNLKIVLFLVVIFMVACNVSKQNTKLVKDFEGKIVYDLKFEDKTGAMPNDQAKMMIGEEQVYTIKGNRYKSEMNGMLKMTQIYLGGDSLFTQIGGMKNLMWADATSNPDELKNFEIKEGVETIAGIKCDMLIINSEEGTSKYYFNKKYKADPKNFSKHEYGFWKLCIDKTGSLPLKSIYDTKELYMEIIAKDIKEMMIDNAEFVLPNLPRVKSPENN